MPDGSDAAPHPIRLNAEPEAAKVDPFPEWFLQFLNDRQTRKPSAHTMTAYRQDFIAIATLVTNSNWFRPQQSFATDTDSGVRAISTCDSDLFVRPTIDGQLPAVILFMPRRPKCRSTIGRLFGPERDRMES